MSDLKDFSRQTEKTDNQTGLKRYTSNLSMQGHYKVALALPYE